MQKQRIFVLSLMLVITVLLLMTYSKSPSETQIAVQGVADLSGTDLEKKPIINLDGEWEFYWNKLLEPADFLKNKQGKSTWIEIPGSWSRDIAGNTFPAKGCATYRLIVQNIPSKMTFGLKKENIRNASRIFVNGELLMEAGKPADSIMGSMASNNPQIIYFELHEPTAEIIVQAANYEYVSGGIVNSIVFGQHEALTKQYFRQVLFEAVMVTILLLVGILYLFFFVAIKDYRKRERVMLPFALNSLLFGIANGFLSQRVLTIVFPMISFEMMFKIFYFSVYGTFLTMLMFVNTVNKIFLPDKIRNVLAGIFSIYLIGIIFLPIHMYLKFAGIYMAIDIVVLLAIFVWTLYKYIKGDVVDISMKVHSILLVALFGANVYTIDQVLYSTGWVKDMNIGFISIVFYTVALVYLLAVRYTEAYEKNEEMSIELVESYYSLYAREEEARRNEVAFLQAQIKPHFLFNSMSSVISLCYTDGNRAGRILADLMNYLKRSFDIDNKSDYITIDSEIKLIQTFIAIEKERFGNKIEVNYKIDPDALPLHIIPLVIEPLVENAIRHGLMKNKRGGIVTLTIIKQTNGILVSVEDNGKGMSDEQIRSIKDKDESDKGLLIGNGIGLSNIDSRLKGFYGEELHFETGSTGTKVYFTVPFIESEAGIDEESGAC